MALDYSTLTDAELEAIANDDYSKLSDATLKAISDDSPAPPEPGMMQKAGQAVMDYAVKPVAGAVGTGIDLAAQGYNAIPGHDILAGIGLYKAAPHLANKAGAVYEGTKQGAKIMYDMAKGAATGPVMPGTPANPAAVYAGQGAAPAPAAQQPGLVQRAMDISAKMRELAAQKAMQFGTSGAAVPAAVGVGGAAATGLAGGQMRAMTPEQRKKFYDNPMLGAMGGDAALGAAIMNRGE